MTQSRLPPLTALKTFECTGRLLSFTLAAGELGVTPGAVSRQIKVLEDYLGLQLFIRSGREVSLTKAGGTYLAQLTEAFARIRAATSELIGVPEDAPLRVSSSVTFTMRWLMPRLMSFHSRHADSNLQLTMNLAPVDFQRDDLDATIKLGYEDTPHSVVRRLFRADLVPVCSPRLIDQPGGPADYDWLGRHTLLHSSARPDNWLVWLRSVGRPELKGARQLQFESSSLAYQAAIEGVGIAMAQLPLVLEDLRTGALVLPFPVAVRDTEVYNLIWPDRTPRNRGFLPFRDWILAEAQRTEAEIVDVLARLESGRAGPL
ncbi:MAG TPA: LysR substrate-binding domain-containing protein [Novosphingobium sp.]|nr:LysR substrate-binding domain-containing protein [Novosphingobium sp.]HZV09993.1 LysR substrate-binding domain-containing protein [Novosphingobium sp.]